MILVLLFYVSATRFDQVNLLAILEFHLSAAEKKNLTCRDLLKKVLSGPICSLVHC